MNRIPFFYKPIYSIFMTLVFFVVCAKVSATVNIQQSLDNMLLEADEHVSIGIKVMDVHTNRVVYEKNAVRTYTPASNQKIITAASGLLYLGPDYRFKTKLLRTPVEVVNGVLQGDIVIQFSGDPDLHIRHLKSLIQSLSSQGIQTIQGDVLLDKTAYGGEELGPGWMWDDMRHCFSAPIGADIINQNCVGVRVRPGAHHGVPVDVVNTETSRHIVIQNLATTKRADTKHCYLRLKPELRNQYALEGCLSLNSPVQGFSVSLDNPSDFNLSAVRQLIQDEQIRVMGTVKYGRLMPNAFLVSEHSSVPLKSFIREMLKESDNLISDSLFKKLGSTYFKGEGTWKSGSKAIRNILATKLKLTSFTGIIADGSGLSRYNLISPEQMVILLKQVYHHPDISAVFIEALPSSGIDGTLKYRMSRPGLRGKVRAKTGTMGNVTALSGFLFTKSQQVLVFSMMINGVSGSTRSYQLLQDQISELLIEHYS